MHKFRKSRDRISTNYNNTRLKNIVYSNLLLSAVLFFAAVTVVTLANVFPELVLFTGIYGMFSSLLNYLVQRYTN